MTVLKKKKNYIRKTAQLSQIYIKKKKALKQSK